MTATRTPLRVDGRRLIERLDSLGQIGAIDGGGTCRLALTEADGRGRDLVVTWMHDLGLRVDIDGVGNVVGTWPADRFDPPVMTGSHIDTVATGGRYDGNLGVLAGLEVIETVIETVSDASAEPTLTLDHPLAVAFFTNEEGSRFAPDMLGSLVFVGGLPLEQALDTVAIDGAVLADELALVGYVGGMPSPAATPRAFVELHIEQGPVLEAEGITIGAVSGVQGISWQQFTVVGQSNHAGTTPMAHRHDAGLVAGAMVVAVRDLTDQVAGLVGTVGRIELHPDLVNVVAARATLTVDLRHVDDSVLAQAESELDAIVDRLAADEGVTVTSRPLARFAPVDFDPVAVTHADGFADAQPEPGAGHSNKRSRQC